MGAEKFLTAEEKKKKKLRTHLLLFIPRTAPKIFEWICLHLSSLDLNMSFLETSFSYEVGIIDSAHICVSLRKWGLLLDRNKVSRV